MSGAVQLFFSSNPNASIAGLLVIIFSILVFYIKRKTNKQKAALDFLGKLNKDERLIKSSKFLRKYSLSNEKLTDIANTQDQIIPILNYFEQLATGIRIGIYDKRTVCLSRKMQIINTFKYSKPYIKNIRSELKNPKLFENLEWLSSCFSVIWYKKILFCVVAKRLKTHF